MRGHVGRGAIVTANGSACLDGTGRGNMFGEEPE